MLGRQNVQMSIFMYPPPQEIPKNLTIQIISLALQKSLEVYQRRYNEQNCDENKNQMIQKTVMGKKVASAECKDNEGSKNDQIIQEEKVIDSNKRRSYNKNKKSQLSTTKIADLSQKSTLPNKQIENKSNNKIQDQSNKDIQIQSVKNELTEIVWQQQLKIQNIHEGQKIIQQTSAKIPKLYLANQEVFRKYQSLIMRRVESWSHFDKIKNRERRELKKLQ